MSHADWSIEGRPAVHPQRGEYERLQFRDPISGRTLHSVPEAVALAQRDDTPIEDQPDKEPSSPEQFEVDNQPSTSRRRKVVDKEADTDDDTATDNDEGASSTDGDEGASTSTDDDDDPDSQTRPPTYVFVGLGCQV